MPRQDIAVPAVTPTFGPIYAETDMSRFPVEPFNTFSNLIFLCIVLIFAKKTRLNFKRHPLIVGGLPILLVGFAGGTMFHATRVNRIWLLLDFMPIFILSILACIYFWRTIVRNLPLAVVLGIGPLIGVRMIRQAIPADGLVSKFSFGYASLAFLVLLPILLHSARRQWRGLRLIAAAAALFTAAIYCREIDRGLGATVFPMGTHFLWHLLGGTSVWLLLEYIYRAASFTPPPAGQAHPSG